MLKRPNYWGSTLGAIVAILMLLCFLPSCSDTVDDTAAKPPVTPAQEAAKVSVPSPAEAALALANSKLLATQALALKAAAAGDQLATLQAQQQQLRDEATAAKAAAAVSNQRASDALAAAAKMQPAIDAERLKGEQKVLYLVAALLGGLGVVAVGLAIWATLELDLTLAKHLYIAAAAAGVTAASLVFIGQVILPYAMVIGIVTVCGAIVAIALSKSRDTKAKTQLAAVTASLASKVDTLGAAHAAVVGDVKADAASLVTRVEDAAETLGAGAKHVMDTLDTDVHAEYLKLRALF